MNALTTQEAKKINNPANKSKRENGYVFATVNGITGFYDIKKIPLKELKGLTIEQFISETNKQIENLHKRIDKVVNEYNKTIADMKRGVTV